MDNWNPTQYEKFKDQRSAPFHDLVRLLQPLEGGTAVDLGCGTGELTEILHRKTGAASTRGLDSSKNMLARAAGRPALPGLIFEKGDIREFRPSEPVDLLFSNAALQWVGNHEALFPRLLSGVKPGGQIAIQMPANFDHPSHRIAAETAARLFPGRFAESPTPVLGIERYAEILYDAGFREQSCTLRVYGHPMKSGLEVVEWTKGTLLTRYESALTADEFGGFVSAYARELTSRIGEGPYFYAFKRCLLWGVKSC